jgi:predicted unusual protein kinase regulating ubiquinone biosynthesis (AarF/ABC1/UbiB family)
MLKNIQKNLDSIIFLLHTFFIIFTELFYYVFIGNYSLFIDRLTKRLASINILCVKIFQAFALNNSLIDDKINNKLMKFTDNAPWNYADININELIEIADKYDLQTHDSFDIPINSGMISLVFKLSKNKNPNEKVIIKMKRKNIQEKLDMAINNLLFLMYILSYIPFVKKYQLAEVVSKNIEIIRHQTNFLEEVDNMTKIRENCKYLKYVKIPIPYKEVTEQFPNVIMMEYINGLKINEIEEEDYEDFAKQVVKFGLVTTIIHGVTHGDLHSGNILFIKDKTDTNYPHKIGVIDFGIIYNVDNQYKGVLFDILTKMFDLPPRDSAEKILNSGIIDPPGILKKISKDDYNNILSFTENIISETVFESKKANQIQIYKFLSQLKEYLSKKELMDIGIKPSDNFVKSQLVLAMAHGVTLTLCRDDFMSLMDKVLNELFHTKMLF